MAHKTPTAPATTVTPEVVSGPADTNTAKPRKPRVPSIKYVKLEESAYAPVNGQKPENPLDQLVELHRGGVIFPGVIFENHILGALVKIPAKAAYIPAPTLRQLMAAIDKLYSEKKS